MKALYQSLFMVLVLFFLTACSSKPSTPTPTTVPTPADSPTPTPAVLTICVAVANVRSGPGTNYPVLKTLSQGDSITPLQKSGEWYYLGQDDAKNDTYVHESVVCPQVEVTATPESTSPDSTAPSSSCPTGCVTQPAGCAIKGNISSKTNAKTYYLPADPGYDLIIVDPDYGERWFCTEAEAKANGWKHSAN